MKIKGKVQYQNLGMGFWGIIDAQGNQWRPVNLPEKLKKEGLEVSLNVKKIEEDFSIFMWGTAVKVL